MDFDGAPSQRPLGLRFNLRTVIAAITLIALLLGLGPWLYDWYVWRARRLALESWAAGLDGNIDKSDDWLQNT